MTDVPIIALPGSEAWEDGYYWGRALDEAFPNQDADEFASACAHNDAGPANDHQITGFVMQQQGENDEASWVWQVTFDDGSVWIATGSCDYTGWDCQSSLEWAT